jgi:protein phosphatase
LLTQAVGTAEPLEHVLARVDTIKTGDRFLLCTDGLYNAVSDEQIFNSLALGTDAHMDASSLISKALANGTRDNVTVLVVAVTGDGKRCFTIME